MSGQIRPSSVATFPEVARDLIRKTLVVGDLARWTAQGRIDASLTEFLFVDIATLSADLVNEIQPDIVLSPLIANNFDAVDVAMRLVDLQFQGKYRAIASDLPDASMICKEIRSFAAKLDFDLLLLPQPHEKWR